MAKNSVSLSRLAAYWRGCLLMLCLVAAPATVVAQAVPLLGKTLGNTAEKQNLPLPRPTELIAGWWHYFDGAGIEPAELEQRIQDTIASLTQLLPEIPARARTEARAFVDLIEANLQTLPQARAKTGMRPPAPPAYAETYTTTNVFALARRLHDLQAEVTAEATDYATAEQDINGDVRRNDTQFAAYSDLATSDPNRVLLGLEIMASRLALNLSQERLRLRKSELDVQKTRGEQLKDELAVAEQRLTANPGDLSRLDDAIGDTDEALQLAHASMVKAMAHASGVVGDNAEGRATEKYRQQRVAMAQVKEADLKLRLIGLRGERALIALLLYQDNVTGLAPHDLLPSWQSEVADINTETATWASASERERRRTGTSSSDPLNNPKPDYIAFLNLDRFALAQETLVAIDQLRSRTAHAELVLELIEEQLIEREGWFKRALAYSRQLVTSAWDNASGWINASLFTIGDTPVTAVGLFRIVLIVTFAWWISHWLRRVLGQLGSRGDGSNLPAFYTIGRLSHYLIILLGLIIGLTSIGMDFTSFALVAGALAIGIGFGLQAIVNNFISGLILLFERSLKVGDFVELGTGVAGEVRAINVRSTQIKTNEDIDIVVPNSELMNTQVINWTLQEPYRRMHYPFRVAFGADKEQVRKAGLEAAENVTHTLSGIPGKNPQVWIVGFGDNGYDFELVVWLTPSAVKRPSSVKAAYYWELESALAKFKIDVPVPQRDLYLRGGFAESTATLDANALAEAEQHEGAKPERAAPPAQDSNDTPVTGRQEPNPVPLRAKTSP